jgi:hypothetical protein
MIWKLLAAVSTALCILPAVTSFTTDPYISSLRCVLRFIQRDHAPRSGFYGSDFRRGNQGEDPLNYYPSKFGLNATNASSTRLCTAVGGQCFTTRCRSISANALHGL